MVAQIARAFSIKLRDNLIQIHPIEWEIYTKSRLDLYVHFSNVVTSFLRWSILMKLTPENGISQSDLKLLKALKKAGKQTDLHYALYQKEHKSMNWTTEGVYFINSFMRKWFIQEGGLFTRVRYLILLLKVNVFKMWRLEFFLL